MSAHVAYTLDMFMMFRWPMGHFYPRTFALRAKRRQCEDESVTWKRLSTIAPQPSQLRILAFALLPSPFNENACI